ncbi:MAG: hypothetical protein HYY24_01300 [Verrucomicrobia bacterium]|nr:hypothetical protein [Verrucomicrobiota bacterium]
MQESLNVMRMFTILMPQVPVLLVCLAGMVIALLRWRSTPTSAALCFAAFTLGLGLNVVFPCIQVWLTMRGTPPDQIGRVFLVLGVLRGLLAAVMLALLLVAVFAGRATQLAAAPNDPPRVR